MNQKIAKSLKDKAKQYARVNKVDINLAYGALKKMYLEASLEDRIKLGL